MQLNYTFQRTHLHYIVNHDLCVKMHIGNQHMHAHWYECQDTIHVYLTKNAFCKKQYFKLPQGSYCDQNIGHKHDIIKIL